MTIEKANKFVVIDVETTGNRPHYEDRMIEIGLTVIEDMQITETFSSFLHCEREIPTFVSQLTGIQNEDLVDAPAFSALAANILQHLDGACLVAHHVDFDLQFLDSELERAGYNHFQGPVLDTVEMARLFYPYLSSYRLQALAEHFSLTHENPHRAGSDAEVTARLLLLMIDKLYSLPPVTLKQLEPYTRYMRTGLHDCVYVAMKMVRQRHQTYVQNYDIEIERGLAIKKQTAKPSETSTDSISFSAEDFFGWNGKLARVSPSFEYREGQVEMANNVHTAFVGENHLLVEAATGTGKTLAYLYPSIKISRETKHPVVIATETIALQQQIKDRDVPLLEKALGIPVKAAVLKGRSHYLCLQKFQHFLERISSSYDEQLTAAQLLVWLTETETGDIEELNLPSGGYALWEELKSDPDSCTPENCSFFSRCFYQRAKTNARYSDVIITNHALLFTDHFEDTRIIPSYHSVVVDEAHHLEETAGRHLGASSSYQHFMRLFNRFGIQESSGLFSNIEVLIDVRKMAFSLEWLSERKAELQSLQYEWHQLFIALQTTIVKKQKKNDRKSHTYDPKNLGNLVYDTWKRVEMIGKDVNSSWRTFIEQAQEKPLTPAEETLVQKISSLCNDLEEIHRTLYSLITASDEHEVYWTESDAEGRPDRLRLYRRPVNIAERLENEFFPKAKSMVLTSATLTVKESFQYMIDQLGLQNFEPKCLHLVSPFYYKRQAELLIPEDFPEIRHGGEGPFIYAVAELVSLLMAAVKGRILVLFTSYQMLKETYQTIKPWMADLDFALFGQGMHGDNRSKLVKQFRNRERAVLLGTSTFWEGIDLPGDDVRALIIVRLPFAPPDDPVYKAKAEQIEANGGNPFMQLAIPRAVLRFKQGFGRLIRTKNDRGLVFVLDKRLIKARYGKMFLRSLPEVPTTYASTNELLDRASDFFSQEGDEDK
ncbi:ATP-dependent DNA helicase DinG [Geomicrobium halophilum]|uniref:3'-5' exonuclease DinG n=1 Tax=Geomicrobium halophilum TaxID=549000 RepID=A0A841PY71_9BACL|nr:ATP-dependent DNA helicase DinG [Geomicrobium halophilum]MBB6449065.1 ATP-dependent DNA helicase DinG [Geomicrobium halophilum]